MSSIQFRVSTTYQMLLFLQCAHVFRETSGTAFAPNATMRQSHKSMLRGQPTQLKLMPHLPLDNLLILYILLWSVCDSVLSVVHIAILVGKDIQSFRLHFGNRFISPFYVHLCLPQIIMLSWYDLVDLDSHEVCVIAKFDSFGNPWGNVTRCTPYLSLCFHPSTRLAHGPAWRCSIALYSSFVIFALSKEMTNTEWIMDNKPCKSVIFK